MSDVHSTIATIPSSDRRSDGERREVDSKRQSHHHQQGRKRWVSQVVYMVQRRKAQCQRLCGNEPGHTLFDLLPLATYHPAIPKREQAKVATLYRTIQDQKPQVRDPKVPCKDGERLQIHTREVRELQIQALRHGHNLPRTQAGSHNRMIRKGRVEGKRARASKS